VNLPRFRSARKQAEEEASRERADRLQADPAAAVYVSYLAAEGVPLVPEESPYEQATRALAIAEAHLVRLQNALARKIEAQSRPGYERRGAASIARTELEIEQVEERIKPLWAALNRAVLRDSGTGESEPIVCQYCATRIADKHLAYRFSGACEACYRVGAGLDKPKVDAEQAYINKLVSRI